ncbi:MAG: hypothetical protein WC338_07230 [Candidatus Ratteibacteria bacterium]|jgi:dienelactone hydrolase
MQKAKMDFRESSEGQNSRLAEQVRNVRGYLKKLADESDNFRKKNWAIPKGISPEGYRNHIRPFRTRVGKMLGYPPSGRIIKNIKPVVRKIGRDEDGTFFRVRIPLLEEGYEVHGLLIKPNPSESSLKKPLAVAIHGGGGTPELAAGILELSNNYNDMGRRMARRGHVVWMPSCFERTGFHFSPDGVLQPEPEKSSVHRTLDWRAKFVGTTLPALDLFGIIKSTEILLASQGFTKRKAIVMGLSYGGFRALLACALSEVFIACISSCYFNDRRTELERYSEEGAFSDWVFNNTLGIATDVEFCQLICPRPLFIEVGNKDELFPAAGARKAASEVRKIYRSLGLENLFGFDVFPGGHEFSGVKAFRFLDRIYNE